MSKRTTYVFLLTSVPSMIHWYRCLYLVFHLYFARVQYRDWISFYVDFFYFPRVQYRGWISFYVDFFEGADSLCVLVGDYLAFDFLIRYSWHFLFKVNDVQFIL